MRGGRDAQDRPVVAVDHDAAQAPGMGTAKVSEAWKELIATAMRRNVVVAVITGRAERRLAARAGQGGEREYWPDGRMKALPDHSESLCRNGSCRCPCADCRETPAPALDPERLARALHETAEVNHPPMPWVRAICNGPEHHAKRAADLAAAYAADGEASR
jgi:hypothetical protein